MTTATDRNVNGVPVDQLVETMRAIHKDPGIAKFQFRAANEWKSGANNRTAIQGFYGARREDANRKRPFVLEEDEPPVLLGTDHGPNPVEVLLAGLAGCLTTSLVYHAAAMGIDVESVESKYEGDLDLHGFLGMDPKVRNGFQDIRVAFKVKANCPPEKIEELVRVAQARSPVFDSVTRGVPVSVRLEA